MKKLNRLLPLLALALVEAIAPRARVLADANTPDQIKALQTRLIELNEDALAIQAKADAETASRPIAMMRRAVIFSGPLRAGPVPA